jgi:hypothetical protein
MRRVLALRLRPPAPKPPPVEVNCTPILNEVHLQSTIRGKPDEYVELYNPCPTRFAFGPDWKLVVHEALGPPGDPPVLKQLAGMTIAPRGYLLVAGDGYADPTAKPHTTFNPVVGVTLPTDKSTAAKATWDGRAIPSHTIASSRFAGGWLSSMAATVALSDGARIVDSVSWGTASVKGSHRSVQGTAVLPPPPGLSLARRPNAANTRNNQQDFIVQQPTPGRTNY